MEAWNGKGPPEMAGEEIIRIEGAWAFYNSLPVLEDITLSVGRRDFLAVIGPNGSGKTTLLKLILGVLKPVRGAVTVFGRPPEEGRRYIGYLPQKTEFDPSFPINVFDVVLMGRYRGLFKGYADVDREAAHEALRMVGMDEHAGRQLSELSGGQIQRVFIARAVVREPSLLLLDEPMASIDPEMQKSFYELLSRLREKMAVVMVTHDVGVMSVYVDKIACVNRRLFYHGSAEDGLDKIEEVYRCPVELVAHGVPHRVYGGHGGHGGGEGAK